MKSLYKVWANGEMFLVDDMHWFEQNGVNYILDGIAAGHHQNFIIMRPIAITDNVGRSLYEGDIIEDSIGVGRIEYAEYLCGFRVNYGNGRCKWFHDYLGSELTSIRLIGNIHEKPNRPLGEY